MPRTWTQSSLYLQESRARIGEAVRLGLNFTGEFSQRVLPILVTSAQRTAPLIQNALQQEQDPSLTKEYTLCGK